MDYFLTPNPNLILRSDGVVIPKDVGEGREQSSPEALTGLYNLYREFVSPDSELLHELKAHLSRVTSRQPPPDTTSE